MATGRRSAGDNFGARELGHLLTELDRMLVELGEPSSRPAAPAAAERPPSASSAYARGEVVFEAFQAFRNLLGRGRGPAAGGNPPRDPS